MEKNAKWFVLTTVLVFAVGLLAGSQAGMMIERKHIEKYGPGRHMEAPCDISGGPQHGMKDHGKMEHGMMPGGGHGGPGGPGGPGGGPGMEKGMKEEDFRAMMLQKISDDLSLTEEQEGKVKEIFESNEKEMLEMRERMRAEMTEFDEKITKQLSEILNDEQKEKLKKIKEERDRMMQMEMRGGGFKPPMPPPMEMGGGPR